MGSTFWLQQELKESRCLCMQDIWLRMSLKEFLQHSKVCRGVLGQVGNQATKQAGKQTSK